MNQLLPNRVVLDTNVCLDLFVFNDPRWDLLLEGLRSGSIKAVSAVECRMEWLAVLHYPHLPITDDTREGIIELFDEVVEIVIPVMKLQAILPRCSDKDDQKFLEIARDSRADVLITKDKALLKLARKNRQAGLFRIETPEKFVASLKNNP